MKREKEVRVFKIVSDQDLAGVSYQIKEEAVSKELQILIGCWFMCLASLVVSSVRFGLASCAARLVESNGRNDGRRRRLLLFADELAGGGVKCVGVCPLGAAPGTRNGSRGFPPAFSRSSGPGKNAEGGFDFCDRLSFIVFPGCSFSPTHSIRGGVVPHAL